ncbi:glycoside hydrolase family 3 N-terminal domain-containing protein [Micromonospora sp. NPDC049679]|uniref:beta-xylosidase/alpha-l-arabinosidase n=1 Tax=Micromonospora sp. NPDC049679 TaxID=3155920 RepID=UPI0033EC906F
MSSDGNATDAGRTRTGDGGHQVTTVHDGQLLAAPADGRHPVPPLRPDPWQDASLPVARRVDDLLARLTLEEKVAQLYGMWLGAAATDQDMAPHQHDLVEETLDWATLIRDGLGQLTRPFGTAPLDPALGAHALARLQTELVAASRFGIPAIAHEECLSGFMTWGATVYPTPLAWGASFDPALVERMAAQIGAAMRQLGVHQGLSPVLDVTRDPRWGRTEETIGEDPYLVATIGTAYVRGLQSTGIVATLKHFAGYSASRSGRNFAPVAVGPRELADTLLLPFEMAIRDGGARSVMHSYTEIDGVPSAADGELLTGLLRETWGFTGTVVSDYFGVSFLQSLHRVAATPAEAAGLALAAGIDIELPAVRCFGPPLIRAVREGRVPESAVDRAARRVLRQKCELGLLDPDWQPTPTALTVRTATEGGDPDGVPGSIDLDPPRHRELARELAEESVVLLANDGTLPLRPGARIVLVGPLADSPAAMLNCYSFPSHVATEHPDLAGGVAIPTLLQALRAELPSAALSHVAAGTIDRQEMPGIVAAAAAAGNADICVAVVGDRAGLFGNGTSGEGCDAEDLTLPGQQGELLDAVLATETPVVLVVLSGRPYALGRYADRLAAVVQAFFPGEEGGSAVAGVLTGRVCPSGRLPVSVPRRPGGQPATYLAPPLGHRTEVSSIDPTALYPFGHGLSYTSFSWENVRIDGEPVPAGRPVELGTDAALTLSLTVRNTGDRPGAEVVQLYLHDPVAQVTRPVIRLTGYARVALAPGEARAVDFRVHADLACFTGRAGERIVEPGELELRLSASSADDRHTVALRLVGPERRVDHRRQLAAEVTVR